MSGDSEESFTRPFGVSSSEDPSSDPANTRPTLPLPTEFQTQEQTDELPTGDSPATRVGTPDYLSSPTPSDNLRSGALWETVEATGEFQPGQLIFNRYIVQGKLGRGGMGTVWLVTHRELNTDRAIKLIVAGISFDTQARARFRREAQVMARFSHPNAVTVHDARLTEQDVAFIDMEYIRGQSLDRVIQRGIPMPLDWTGRVLNQLCDVLQVAHDNGIVHRDLKPANLMLLDDRPYGKEHLKVLDFGIAKILREVETEGGPNTMTGLFMGTPPYASPEQADGKADTRSDVYSVGVILYEFLTGFRPFSGPAARVLVDTITTPPPPFSVMNPNVSYPPGIEDLVQRCLAKQPENRPQSTREIAEAFANCLPKPAEPTTSPIPPVRLPWIPVALVGLALMIGAGWWVSRDRIPGANLPPRSSMLSNGMAPPEGYVADPKSDLDSRGLPMTVVPTGLLADTGMRMVLLPGGKMRTGIGPLAVDQVAPFAMSETEVTNGQMKAYFKDQKVEPPDDFQTAYDQLLKNRESPVSPQDADRHPAVGISRTMAEAFARWAGGSLPTEQQWAYAARSGGDPSRLFVWPDPQPPIAEGGRANLETLSSIPTKTTKVKNFPDDRTDQGIYDMMGNVREWTKTPGRSAAEFVVRGGSFLAFASGYTNFRREFVMGDEELDDLGFRIVINSTGTNKSAP